MARDYALLMGSFWGSSINAKLVLEEKEKKKNNTAHTKLVSDLWAGYFGKVYVLNLEKNRTVSGNPYANGKKSMKFIILRLRYSQNRFPLIQLRNFKR